MDFSRFQTATAKSKDVSFDQGLRDYMLQVYNYMFLGLGITGLVAYGVGHVPSLLYAIHGTPLRWVAMLAPLGMVLYLSAKINSMKFSTAKTLFWVYAAVMGLSLSSIFAAYTGASISRAFFISASMFGGMSLYGYTTKKDLTSLGSFLIMGVIGLVVLMIINMFVQSSAMQIMISLAAIAIFVGLTAYDTQKIKNYYYQFGAHSEQGKKAGLMGALALYLDFINIFIHLLRLVGERR
jgi:FtsH-binding integral membrane protein